MDGSCVASWVHSVLATNSFFCEALLQRKLYQVFLGVLSFRELGSAWYELNPEWVNPEWVLVVVLVVLVVALVVLAVVS